MNPRASRTVPFVAKVIGLPVAKIAARIMAGEKVSRADITGLGVGGLLMEIVQRGHPRDPNAAPQDHG